MSHFIEIASLIYLLFPDRYGTIYIVGKINLPIPTSTCYASTSKRTRAGLNAG